MSFLHQIGISLQPLGNERAEIYELAKRNNFGIEVVDFAMPRILNDKNKYEELIAKNKSELLGFNDLSFHGPFIDIVLHSADEDIRTISRKKIERAISSALELHCKTIVFHTGINTLIKNPSYSKKVIESHSEFWSKVISEYKEITICLENLWEHSFNIFEAIFKNINNPRIKLCLDTGHANIFSKVPIVNWINKMPDYISYMHFNDNLGDADTELAVGDGNIKWTDLINAILEVRINPRIVLEVGTIHKIEQSIEYIKRQA